MVALANAQETTPLVPNRLMPLDVGPTKLDLLTPGVLEISRVIRKPVDPAPIEAWDFQDAEGHLQLPAPTDFEVLIGGRPVPVTRVGFRRRPLYAPLRTRDLRVGNWLYLELASQAAAGEIVQVRITYSRMSDVPLTLTVEAAADRLSSAIHVNQEGYLPDLPKVAFVGAFLGTLGELHLPPNTPFEVVDCASNEVVFRGTLVARRDVGFMVAPVPYQEVLAADFSAVTRPGQYRLRVAGLGASYRFRIAEDIAALFARTYALGLYHQRCGTSNSLPYTRFTHGICHDETASVPTTNNLSVGITLWNMTVNYASNPLHTAPRLCSVDASLYPFVRTNRLDVSLGHHDAGDYSKYTINSAQLINTLVFAVDTFPGVSSLDNLGLPESGDGRSDLLQEAKWEADFLVKMQDADGGFYFLVYPEGRSYEDNVLPDAHDLQVVFPKNASATAAATAALAQIASSPTFRALYPEEAARYLAAARRGWDFLQAAIAKYGYDGSYQQISHYGDVFMHYDELAWAAAELFAATGEPEFERELKEHYSAIGRGTHRWTWWQAFEGYGGAIRSYAFAARSGRLPAAALDPVFLAQCEAEIISAGNDVQRWSQESAYGTSFPDASKRMGSAGWYFSLARAFDLAAAYQLQPRPEWLATIVGNLNYEAGANPINECFITGLGVQRPSILVSQYAMNDNRFLPPSGFPIGQLQNGFSYLNLYKTELGLLCLPRDGAPTNAYPMYDRWGDSWNTRTEAVTVDQARGLSTLAFLMARTPLRAQPWRAQSAAITVVPTDTPGSWACSLTASNFDLSAATIVWEVEGYALTSGTDITMNVSRTGKQWVETEAQLPDGRRVFAATSFLAARAPNPALPTVTITAPDADAARTPLDLGRFEILRTGDLTKPLTVAYAIGGSARNGTDYAWINGSQYTVNSGTIVMPAGTNRVSLNVIPSVASKLTNDANVIITLSDPGTYNIGLPNQATVLLRLLQPGNHAPKAVDIMEFMPPGANEVRITLSGTDPDLNPLQYVIVTPPTGGTLTGQPPNLVYVPGLQFTGTDRFTYLVSDGQLASLPATVTVNRAVSSSVGFYPFDGSFSDSLGLLPSLTPVGTARLEAGAIHLLLVDDAVAATLPATAVVMNDRTIEITFEARLFVQGFLAYGKDSYPLMRLYRNWNAFLELRQDKWARSAHARGGALTVASTAQLATALTPGQWHQVSLRLNSAGYRVLVDGQLIATVASTDLKNWRLNGALALELGHFAGWLDSVEIRVTQP